MDKYAERLALLAKGKLTEAAAVTTGGGKAADTAKSLVEADEGENADGNVQKGTSKGNGMSKVKAAASTPSLDGKLFLAWCCHGFYCMWRKLSDGCNSDGTVCCALVTDLSRAPCLSKLMWSYSGTCTNSRSATACCCTTDGTSALLQAPCTEP